ncbi:MAG TPA: serine/threonine-protein kinase, partial [Myxococcaceae bacterium]|nr:serine/threonine-protein kinase [Myxococcaceae bacterium]
VRRLGLGGYSCVFQMEHAGRPFTMKMATRPASEADLTRTDERAVREAVSLGHFRHPNLPRVHETGRWPDVEKGYFYLVTDYQPGRTFNQWRWEESPSLRRLVRVLAEVARVLAELHEQGVFHRDFKADNLLILDEDERPVLIDFGAAYVPGAYPLTELLPPATLHNLPPECVALLHLSETEEPVEPLPATAAMDLYAFGCLLYEALTDRHAFPPRLPRQVLLQAITLLPPKAPCELEPRAPESLSELTLRLLAKEPEQRPASARAVYEELLRLLEQEGDTEAWTVPYAFSAPPEEVRADAVPPAVEEKKGRTPGRGGRRWAGVLLTLALGGVGLGIGWGDARSACATLLAEACGCANATAPNSSAPAEKGRTPVSSSHPVDDLASPSPPSRLGGLCKLLGACATVAHLSSCVSVPVRMTREMESFLQQCPPEARETATRLPFFKKRPFSEVEFTSLTDAGPPGSSPLNIRSGPVEGWLLVDFDGSVRRVTGVAKVFPDRVYVQLDRIYLDSSHTRGPDGVATPGSEEAPICAVVMNMNYSAYGINTFTDIEGHRDRVDLEKVDRGPEAAMLHSPLLNVRLQFPEGDARNRY